MKAIDLSKVGKNRKECSGCGIKFTPKKSYHHMCDDCTRKHFSRQMDESDIDEQDLQEVEFRYDRY